MFLVRKQCKVKEFSPWASPAKSMLWLIIILLIAELGGSNWLVISVMGGECEFLILGLSSLENECRHLLSRSSLSYNMQIDRSLSTKTQRVNSFRPRRVGEAQGWGEGSPCTLTVLPAPLYPVSFLKHPIPVRLTATTETWTLDRAEQITFLFWMLSSKF